ncbi:hypothetical protein ACFU9B_42195 [Streptomyces sp. NPDC057592]|uniref:hypothetical protein n=1 Tax=unclassified Streptomyces TaxID=2593676 RepID=UPI0036A3BD1F
MSIEASGTVDAEIVDAEIVEPGRLDRMKEKAAPHAEKARAALTEQKARVGLRVAMWFKTADVSDAELAEEIAKRHRQRARELQDQKQRRVVAEAGAEEGVQEGAGVVLAVPKVSAEQLVKVSGGELSRARWAKKAGRAGAVLGGAYAAVNGIAVEPLLALAALGTGGPVTWWYLSRPLSEEEEAAAKAMKEGPAKPGVVGSPVPPAEFVPDVLDAARVSLVKGADERVRGEVDLVKALVHAGVVSAAQESETHIVGLIREDGPGWAATIELPRGMKAGEAISRVEAIASALRIKKSRIELRPDTSEEGHEGRVRLWVANEDNPFGSGKAASPLITAESWDFWNDGIPLGVDARGNRHSLHLLWSSLMIGGIQGFGKSYLARLIGAAGALDPHLNVHVVTGKTGPDWAPAKHVAKSYIAGASQEKIRQVLALMDKLIAEMQAVGEELERLYEEDPKKCPEGKLTPQLAREKGLGLTLLVVDELQELLDAAAMMKIKVDDDPESRSQGRSGKDVLVETFARFVRVTRYVGGMGLFITQRPDAESVPTKLRGVCAKRACFRVKGAASSKMVLGDDAVADGAAPHLLLDSQLGVFVLDAGVEEGHVTLKADTIELPEYKEINLRGRDLRTKAGTLTGYAAEHGQADVAKAASGELLADCLNVLDAVGADRARTESLLMMLSEHRPDQYGDLTTVQLQQRLRDAGAGTTRKLGAIDGMANPNGYTRQQIADAQTGK